MVVSSRKPDACAAAAKELHDKGYRALGVPAHMGELDDIDALVTATVDEYGGVDIVVNAAANPVAQPMGSYTPRRWASRSTSMCADRCSWCRPRCRT